MKQSRGPLRGSAVLEIPVVGKADPSEVEGEALAVVLIDGDTGLPYVATGGGGSGGAVTVAQLPAALGAQADAASLSVTPATDAAAREVAMAASLAAAAASLSAIENDSTTAPIEGSISDDAAVGTQKPIVIGAVARTANRTSVADGDVVRLAADKQGRLIVAGASRELQSDATAIRTASVALGTLLAAGGAGVYRDITSLTFNNSSATDTVVEIYDADGTTLRWSGTAKANDVRGIVFPMGRYLKGATANAIWQWKTLTSVSSVAVTVTFDTNV